MYFSRIIFFFLLKIFIYLGVEDLKKYEIQLKNNIQQKNINHIENNIDEEAKKV